MAEYQKRIKALVKALKDNQKTGPAAAIFASAAPRYRGAGRDIFLQDKDFVYLTGSNLEQSYLVLSSNQRPTLFAYRQTKLEQTWEGKTESAAALAKSLDAELVYYRANELHQPLQKTLAAYAGLFLNRAAREDSLLRSVIEASFASISSRSMQLQKAELLTAPLRMVKTASEVKLIKQAATITRRALAEIEASEIRAGQTEAQIAAALQYQFRKFGADYYSYGFPSIVAAGGNAAVLHYSKLSENLKANQAVLIDCGAVCQHYCADLTRCFFTAGAADSAYHEIVEIVTNAQQKAIKKIKPGVKFKTVQALVIKELTTGLRSLGILNGPTSDLVEAKAYLPFFMHGFGHSLGLDVHDFLPPGTDRFERDMVFTVEPGLYFAQATGGLPKGGVRIEDDIVVTADGCEVL